MNRLNKYLDITVKSIEELEAEGYQKRQQLNNVIFSKDDNDPHYLYCKNNTGDLELISVFWKKDSNRYETLAPSSFYFLKDELNAVSWESSHREDNMPIRIEIDEETIKFSFNKRMKNHIAIPEEVTLDYNGHIKEMEFGWSNRRRFKDSFESIYKEYADEEKDFFENPDISKLDYIQLLIDSGNGK